jgi:hypothetical protein
MNQGITTTNVHRSKWILLLLATVLIFLAAPSASFASGGIYWNNLSWDGSGMNVGDCLANQGGCAGLVAGAPGAQPFWQLSGGAADPNFYLTSSVPLTFTLELAKADNTSSDTFGWYDPSNPTALHVLFLGTATPGTTQTLPAGSYGFYLTDSTVPDTWYTQSLLNLSGEQSDQHFVVFDPVSSYWIGMEDLPFGDSDKDYQDILVKVTPSGSGLSLTGTQGGEWQSWTTVPEPGTISLLVIGLVGAAFKRRKSVR